MRVLSLLLAVACGLSRAPVEARPRQEPGKTAEASAVVRWKGTSYRGADVESTLGKPVAAAAEPWIPWAQAQGYVLDLDPDSRRLFVHREQRGASGELAILARALAAVDKLAPAPAERPPSVLVILELEGPKDFGLLLDDLGKRFSYLTSWAQGTKQQLGFVLEQPLAAAFLATSPDVKEWNPKNELANRATQLALFDRFERLPNWLMQGLAWQVEMNVCGSIYCFPSRSGFVAKKEHRSWSEQLKGVMASGPDGLRQLSIADLTGWKRSTYENDRALLAWGAANFLAKRRAEALPLILEDLRAIREMESKVTKPDGSWQLNPDYEVPPEKQLEILKARAGEDFLAALGKFCAGG
ncbi:MAG TPA: hypothetical protein VK843_10635 [Planctomycetota bacterium]|nr:hypothetical protein [Planctomycetota bacterium]